MVVWRFAVGRPWEESYVDEITLRRMKSCYLHFTSNFKLSMIKAVHFEEVVPHMSMKELVSSDESQNMCLDEWSKSCRLEQDYLLFWQGTTIPDHLGRRFF